MASTDNLDAFLANIGKPELQSLGAPLEKPKVPKKKSGKVIDSTGKNDANNANLLMYQQDAAGAADKLHTALNQLKDGLINKDQVAKIYEDYKAASDRLYAVDAPSATKLQSTFYTPTAATTQASTTSPYAGVPTTGIAPFAPAKTIPVTQDGQLVNPGSKPSNGGASKTPTLGDGGKFNSLANAKNPNQIAQGYGAMGAYAMTIPWMRDLMVHDSQIGRSPTDFANDVKNYTDKNGVKLWDQIDSHIRDSSMAYFDNPQQWARTYNLKLKELQANATQQGLDPSVFGTPIDTNDSKNIDAAYKASAQSIMGLYMTHYYGDTVDPTVLSQWVANHTSFAKTDLGVYGGVLGQNADSLKQYASDMGVASTYLPQKTTGGPDTGDYFANAAKAIQDGTTTFEEQQNYIKQQAISMYQPFAQRINEGLSVRALASPYLNAAQNLMEVGADSIDLGGNTGLGATITKAMRGDGTAPVSLDEFQTQLKKDPAWLNTSNARNSIMDTASQLLGNMGLVN